VGIGLTSWLDGNSVRLSGLLYDMDAPRRDQAQLQSYSAALRSVRQELQETQAQLLQSAKVATVGELAASTAHELNNPLAAIRGLAQVLIIKRSDDTELQETLNQIIVDTDRMTETVRRLLGLVRQARAEPTLVSINQTLAAALSRLSTQLGRHKIESEQAFDPDIPLVRGIPQQLEQVAINLLTNAKDAIVQKEMPGRITLRTWRDSTNRHVSFSVADTGVGIAPEHRADIFSPYFTTKPADRGTGLGLSTSLRIVQEHQGHIVFDSQPGQGTVFTVVLPAGPPAKP
jgi:two-component system NtrC family sensor kinase